MTFLEAALEILKREGRPLHFKELTERAMTKKLLTFVGRTPELTMQTQLTAAIKKAPGNPFVRVKPGTFGLLRYPEVAPEEIAKEKPAVAAKAEKASAKTSDKTPEKSSDRKKDEKRSEEGDVDGRGRRRRRRGGRTARGEGKDAETAEAAPKATASADESAPHVGRAADDGLHEHPDLHMEAPSSGGLSAEARAAALAETGVLEGDDQGTDDDDDDSADDDDGVSNVEESAFGAEPVPAAAAAKPVDSADDDDDDSDDDEPGASEPGEAPAFGEAAGSGATSAESDEAGRRRRRRRRRRRGGNGEGSTEERPAASAGQPSPVDAGAGMPSVLAELPAGDSPGSSAPPTNVSSNGGAASAEGGSDAGQAQRKILAPIDAAIEVLRGQPPGRGVHVRQIADSAIRKRLIHGEPNEAWRVVRTALATETKHRLRNGLRPRVRSAGSGLFTLARRPPDAELEKAEHVFGEARRALRERTMAALERRLAELPPGAFEALARVLLQREGFGPTTFVKRVEGTIYVEALRGRGSRPSRCLIALRAGGTSAGRRTIGELRAGIRARNQDEGVLMLCGRLADDAISEWKQPGAPLEIVDGAAVAETCARHGIGVQSATVAVDFVDGDFFAELAEG